MSDQDSPVADAIEGRLAIWRSELGAQSNRTQQQLRILRIGLEAIYGTPELTLAEARALARQALEDTE